MVSLSKEAYMLLACLVFIIMYQSTARKLSRDWGHMGFIEYIHGSPDTHLIITSVHGGCMEGYNIPRRQDGCYDVTTSRCSWQHGCRPKSKSRCPAITGNDRCTVNLAVRIAEEWEELTGRRPHVVVSHLERAKLNGNRDKPEAAQGNPDAGLAWENLHEFIERAKESVTKNGIGLIVDIHGQAHAEEWVELGYGVTAPFYDRAALEPEFTYIQNALRLSNHSVDDVIRGEHSLGKFLEDFGHTSVPSPGNPSPRGGKYFSGGDLGFITWIHGSRLGGPVDSVLVENPTHLRTPMAASTYAGDFAKALRSFTHSNYGSDHFD